MNTISSAITSARAASPVRILLSGGLFAGPLFMSLSIAQGLTRAGFSLAHQPLSFLGLGDLGWLQRANFVLSGILVIGLSAGVLARLKPSATAVLGALCLLTTATGLIIAGLYPPDPGFGYPIGTPDGIPLHLTRQSAMHGVGFMLSFGGYALASLIFAGRDMKAHRWRYAAFTLLSALVALLLGMWPGITAIAVRDFAAALLLWAWITVLAKRLLG